MISTEKLQVLKLAIDTEAMHAKNIQDKLDLFKEEHEHIYLARDKARQTINDFKASLSIEAREEYVKHGLKQLMGGLGIRIMKKVLYVDSDALVWAETNMPAIIKRTVDSKEFEKYAKENPLDFVTITEDVVVTFPKKNNIGGLIKLGIDEQIKEKKEELTKLKSNRVAEKKKEKQRASVQRIAEKETLRLEEDSCKRILLKIYEYKKFSKKDKLTSNLWSDLTEIIADAPHRIDPGEDVVGVDLAKEEAKLVSSGKQK